MLFLLAIILYWVVKIGVVVLPLILVYRRRTVFWGVAYAILYAGVYLVLTLQGDYAAHNNYQENFGGAGSGRVEIDCFRWFPLFCGIRSGTDEKSGRQIQVESFTALVFWPLLALDREAFHRDRPAP